MGKQLDLDADLQTLHEMLGEETRADGELTRLTKANVNPKASGTRGLVVRAWVR